VQEIMI